MLPQAKRDYRSNRITPVVEKTYAVARKTRSIQRKVRKKGSLMAQDYKAAGRPPMIGACLTIEDWKSYIQGYSWGNLRPTRLVLHHTYRPTNDQWRGLRSMRGMQRFYAGKGWSAAPHVYAAPDGIWLFTPLRDIGVHAGTGNGSRQAGWYSIGLEMVGDFDHQQPSGAVWDNALAVMGGLSIALNIPPSKLISFHRDFTNQKSCPGRAVTKEWVWAEVERWIAAQPGAAPAPFTADPAGLAEELRALTYKQRGSGYHADWAFHRSAISRGLGAPTDISRRAMSGTTAINYQAFGRDILFCVVPHWSSVQSLAQTLAAQPQHTIAQAVRAAVFHDQGITLDAKDALLAAASDLRAGPPIAGLRTTKIGGQRGRLLVCAADTLFLPDGASAVVRLSASGVQAAALIAATFEALGIALPPANPFVAAASSPWQGAPLGPIQILSHQGQAYTAQVYALDTFVADAHGSMQRLSALGAAPQHKGVDESTPGMVEQIKVAAVQGDAAMLVDAGTQHDLTGAHLLITRHGQVLPVPRARMNAQATDPTTLLVLVDQEKDGAPLSATQATVLDRLLQAFEHRYRLPRTAVHLS